MPRVVFSQLPDEARLWVFAAAVPLAPETALTLIAGVDEALEAWRAHGAPLVSGRDWRDDRFLAVAADEAATGASGCSIDALYRAVEALQASVGTSLTTSGDVYWRDAAGVVQGADRPTFRTLAAAGTVGPDTPVFDTTVTSVGAWRRAFEKPARESWHARWLPARV